MNAIAGTIAFRKYIFMISNGLYLIMMPLASCNCKNTKTISSNHIFERLFLEVKQNNYRPHREPSVAKTKITKKVEFQARRLDLNLYTVQIDLADDHPKNFSGAKAFGLGSRRHHHRRRCTHWTQRRACHYPPRP